MHSIGDRNIRQCTFAVTDYGVRIWNETRQYYVDMDPPPPEFVPVSTEGSRIAHLSPEARNAAMFRRMGLKVRL